MIFKKATSIRGEITIPGDKSISHRAIMLGSLADGTTEITNFLQGADCLSTIACFKQMGVNIENTTAKVVIKGSGMHGLTAPAAILDVGNSGTTTRLMSGILAAQNFSCSLTGDASIQKRPMGRIITPLSQMGADITSIKGNGCAPLQINGKQLKAIDYTSPVASAQVKSCVLFAGLYADGTTTVTEPSLSRNHSELMFTSFGAKVTTKGTTASVNPVDHLYGQKIEVPGDISSAAYFIVAGLILPNSEVVIKNVGINPTRDGILKVCEAMGASISYENKRIVSGEPVADLVVRSSSLQGTTIGGDIIPALIDEIPAIAVLACFANGTTVIKDAQELKVKESNRIDEMVNNLSKMGADITATEDGMIINGGKPLHGASINSKLDHRLAMSFAIAGLMADGETDIQGAEVVETSFPTFYKDLERLCDR